MTEVLPYAPSLGVKHSLIRELISNDFLGGYVAHRSAETAETRPDGAGSTASYKGLNQFIIKYDRTLAGATQIADVLWEFFLARLDNINEPFYFYNPKESDVDITGLSATGRYYVRLENPDQALSRTQFQHCLFRYGLTLIETRELVDIVSASLSGSVSPSASLSTPLPAICDDLWGHWNLDETSGTRLDNSGNAHHFTESLGSIGYGTGKIENAAAFQNIVAGLINSDASDLTGDLTLAGWFYVYKQGEASTSARSLLGILFAGDPTAVIAIRIYYTEGENANKFRINGYTDVDDADSGLLDFETWYYAMVEVSSVNGFTFYVNNSVVYNNPAVTSLGATGNSQGLGGAGELGNFGFLWADECALWERVLTSTERAELYNSGNGQAFVCV